MAKIIALYINELIKISRKVSTYVILGIMLIAMFAVGGILKYAQIRMDNMSRDSNIGQFMQQDLQSRIANDQNNLTDLNNQIAAATSDAQKQPLQLQAANLQNEIDSLNTSISMNISLYSDYFVALAIQDVASYKTELNNFQATPADTLTQAQTDEINLLTTLIPKMEDVVTTKDFNEYTSVINDKLNGDTSVTQIDKDIQLEQNNLRLQYNVTNEDSNNSFKRFKEGTTTADQIISNIGTARRSLAYNLDFLSNANSPVPLTTDRRAQITDQITVYDKQLDLGAVSSDNFTKMTTIFAVGIFMVELLLLMLAGSAISQETATGSIKSLIISPTKRWKIYVAKSLSLATVGVAAVILCYLVGLVVYGVYFGFSNVTPYIYTSAGSAKVMNFYWFSFLKLFVGLAPAAFYMVLALMLSTITRNTAASVGISIGILFGGMVGYPALAGILTGEWMKFLPFPNFTFAAKIFAFDPSAATMAGVSTSMTFGVIYILFTLFLMFYIGLDSFNRRDIK